MDSDSLPERASGAERCVRPREPLSHRGCGWQEAAARPHGSLSKTSPGGMSCHPRPHPHMRRGSTAPRDMLSSPCRPPWPLGDTHQAPLAPWEASFLTLRVPSLERATEGHWHCPTRCFFSQRSAGLCLPHTDCSHRRSEVSVASSKDVCHDSLVAIIASLFLFCF